MSTLKWTNYNIKEFLKDCNRLSQLFQMSNIDGAKTGFYIDSDIHADTLVVSSLCKVEAVPQKGDRFYKIERIIPDKVGKTRQVNTLSGTIKEIVGNHVDQIAKLQDRMIEIL